MTTLHLGVFEIPYADPDPKPAPRRGGGRPRPKVQSGAQTTGDVATFLEEKYHVMETFAAEYEEQIIAACVHGMADALENLYAGAPLGDPYAEVGQEVADGFKTYLSLGLIEDVGIPGVPTQAAIRRRSQRFKKRVGPAKRPSFIDTGAYEGSFTAWFED